MLNFKDILIKCGEKYNLPVWLEDTVESNQIMPPMLHKVSV